MNDKEIIKKILEEIERIEGIYDKYDLDKAEKILQEDEGFEFEEEQEGYIMGLYKAIDIIKDVTE